MFPTRKHKAKGRSGNKYLLKYFDRTYLNTFENSLENNMYFKYETTFRFGVNMFDSSKPYTRMSSYDRVQIRPT